MFLWKHMDNYPKIIPVTPPHLEHCSLLPSFWAMVLILEFANIFPVTSS